MGTGRKAVGGVQPKEVMGGASQEDLEQCREGIKTEVSFPKVFHAGGLVRQVDF